MASAAPPHTTTGLVPASEAMLVLVLARAACRRVSCASAGAGASWLAWADVVVHAEVETTRVHEVGECFDAAGDCFGGGKGRHLREFGPRCGVRVGHWQWRDAVAYAFFHVLDGGGGGGGAHRAGSARSLLVTGSRPFSR